jgi:hypothetical protein
MLGEHGRAIRSVLLALEGALILLGATLLAFTGEAMFPVDTVIGIDAAVAAMVLGAAFILAFRTPTRAWVNIAILYNGLTVLLQGWKYLTNYGVHLQLTQIVVPILFLIGFAVTYPREVEIRTPAATA